MKKPTDLVSKYQEAENKKDEKTMELVKWFMIDWYGKFLM